MAWEPLPSDRDSLHDLTNTLARLHKTMGLARPDTLTVLTAQWDSLLGRSLASRCTLESLRGTEMVIATDDTAVADHLRWSSADLIGAVNAICDGRVVESVSVRVRRRSRG